MTPPRFSTITTRFSLLYEVRCWSRRRPMGDTLRRQRWGTKPSRLHFAVPSCGSHRLAKHGTRMDWTLNCQCHGKNMVDPKNSGAKNAAEAETLKETDAGKSRRISPAQQAPGFAGDACIRPYKRITDKKNGLTKRLVYFAPASGPGSRAPKHNADSPTSAYLACLAFGC